MTTTKPILTEAAIAADYLEEHTNFAEAVRILREAAFVTLLEFCDRYAWRHAIGQPWAKDGYLYATDARIAIRIPTSQPDTPTGDARLPKIADVFAQWPVPATAAWQRWPVKPVFVDTAHETGEDCPICHGDGFYYTDGDVRRCVYCDGSGKVQAFDNVELGKSYVAGVYWDKIRRLPDPWYVEPEKADEPVHFRFLGGEGLLMPIKQEDA